MKTFYEWFKEQKGADSLSEMLILCKQAWYEGQRELCLNYNVSEKPPNKEVANVCAECGSHLKWWVTCYRCRNLDCRAEYPHKT